ncbi:uncharacterized protein METZ01_LOCUS245022 [marine metagenome]|uniref:WD40 repeat domain-containing protein n=1 Tax=marine metagenome TaxID=408172 RepID=A0A382HY04_9ZZZZ
MLTPVASAGSAVGLYEKISLSEHDLGLNGAAVDPLGEWAIVFGADSYLELVRVSNPDDRVELIWNGGEDLTYGDFHPGGQTALIVGSEGQVLRYAREDHSVTDAGGDLEFNQIRLTAVAWNSGGSWAYIGGSDGWLWRMRAAADGGAEVHLIQGRGASDITGIDCHPSVMACVVTSLVDGIGIIDRDHTLYWLGGTGHPWSDVVCPTGDMAECVAVSSDRNIARVTLNADVASTSDVRLVQVTEAEGYFTGISHQSDDRSLIYMAPFGLIEHDLSLNSSFPWLENSDAVEYDTDVSGSRIVATWGTDRDSGWILTDRGELVHYHPQYSNALGGVLEVWVLIAIPAVTLLVLLSFALSLSPGLQQRFTLRFGTAEEKRAARREARRKKGR